MGVRVLAGSRLHRLALRVAGAVAAFLTMVSLAPAQPVDLELVLAIDISRSVDFDEGLLRREGYISAFSNPALVAAIKAGYHGRIAVTYFEWASWGETRTIAPWTVISDAKSAAAFTNILRFETIWTGQRTSISQAIDLGVGLPTRNSLAGDLKVIDISGDGHNNHGRHINDARLEALDRGITINGLPIINTNMGPGTPPLPDLEAYYKECVIGGPGSFIVVAQGFNTFAEAVTRKLILEIAGLEPPGGIERFTRPTVQRAQFLQARPVVPPADGPLRYGPHCNVFQGGGGQQMPPMLPLR